MTDITQSASAREALIVVIDNTPTEGLFVELEAQKGALGKIMDPNDAYLICRIVLKKDPKLLGFLQSTGLLDLLDRYSVYRVCHIVFEKDSTSLGLLKSTGLLSRVTPCNAHKFCDAVFNKAPVEVIDGSFKVLMEIMPHKNILEWQDKLNIKRKEELSARARDALIVMIKNTSIEDLLAELESSNDLIDQITGSRDAYMVCDVALDKMTAKDWSAVEKDSFKVLMAIISPKDRDRLQDKLNIKLQGEKSARARDDLIVIINSTPIEGLFVELEAQKGSLDRITDSEDVYRVCDVVLNKDPTLLGFLKSTGLFSRLDCYSAYRVCDMVLNKDPILLDFLKSTGLFGQLTPKDRDRLQDKFNIKEQEKRSASACDALIVMIKGTPIEDLLEKLEALNDLLGKITDSNDAYRVCDVVLNKDPTLLDFLKLKGLLSRITDSKYAYKICILVLDKVSQEFLPAVSGLLNDWVSKIINSDHAYYICIRVLEHMPSLFVLFKTKGLLSKLISDHAYISYYDYIAYNKILNILTKSGRSVKDAEFLLSQPKYVHKMLRVLKDMTAEDIPAEDMPALLGFLSTMGLLGKITSYHAYTICNAVFECVLAEDVPEKVSLLEKMGLLGRIASSGEAYLICKMLLDKDPAVSGLLMKTGLLSRITSPSEAYLICKMLLKDPAVSDLLMETGLLSRLTSERDWNWNVRLKPSIKNKDLAIKTKGQVKALVLLKSCLQMATKK